MVNLFKFYETDNAFYLLLQYASGGKLWNYIGAYIQRGPIFGKERGCNDGVELYGMGPSSNVYAGVKLHGNECDLDEETKPHTNQMTCPTNVKTVPRKLEKDSMTNSLENVDTAFDSKLQRQRVESGRGDVGFNIWENTPVNQNQNSNNISKPRTLQKNVDFENPEMCDKESINVNQQSSRNYDRYISISSEENIDVENERTRTSDSSIKDGEEQFTSCLDNNRQSLTLFSINSVDSSEGMSTLENFMPGKQGEKDSSLHIVHEKDDVFVNDISRPCRILDIEADDMVRNAKELINSVDRTLSQTDSDLEHSLSRSSAKDKFHQPEEFCIVQSDGMADILENSSPPVEMVSTTKNSDNSSSLSPDDEPSIYDTHKMLSSSDSSDIDNSGKTVLKNPVLDRIQDGTVLESDQNVTKSISSDSTSKVNNSETDTSISSEGISKSSPQHLPLSRGNSASCEFDLRSPVKTRSRTISDVFHQLDLAASGPDQVQLPETSIRQWAGEIVIALSRLHSEGIICRFVKFCPFIYS